MMTSGLTQQHEKLALVWAERRERLIAMRICYQTFDADGCTVYMVNSVDELGRAS